MRLFLVAVFCLLSFCVNGNDVLAAVVSIEGTIKSVDAKKRTITVETKTKTLELDVSRKAKVNVKGKTAKLDSLKPGQKVKISYHEGLEIVLKIEASNRPTKYEVLNLEELNFTQASDVNPSLTSDGLQIVWQTRGENPRGKDQWIYTAHRRDADSTFTGKAKLFRGFNPAIRSDGLQLYFYSPDQQGISMAARRKRTDRFRRPRIVPELQFKAYPSGITVDGLTMFLDIHNPQSKSHSPAHSVSRTSVNGKWGKPLPLLVDLSEQQVTIKYIIAASPVLDNGLGVICKAKVQTGGVEEFLGGVLSRTVPNGKFTKWQRISLSSSTVSNAPYFAPLYIPATKELFVQSSGFFTDEETARKRGVDLWVVKDYELPVLNITGLPTK